MLEFKIEIANKNHLHYASQICEEMEMSAKVRGTGIAKRSHEYVQQKMLEGKAVIAFDSQNQWAGFCYIETWQSGEYVANSGLIISPKFRNQGLAKLIKQQIFNLSRSKYPSAKVFGLTTGLAVMKINSDLGYKPVTYSELTTDEQFWNGCKSCINYSILTNKEFKNCLCTAMLYKEEINIENKPKEIKTVSKSKLPDLIKRLTKLKSKIKLQLKENSNENSK